ncbi:MAG: branched-chain amino acid ABC transporter permease [Clostridia bacterium]|nr:branched-chain amino acid ABC transporter permease [Clostridia bacterium]
MNWNAKWMPLAIGGAGLAVCALLGLALSVNTTLVMSRIVIMILFALSLNIQTGYAGLGNMGHALYFGLGSYGILVFVSKFGFNLITAVLATIALFTFASIIIGFLTLQSDSLISFLFLSFGICLLVNTAFAKWAWIGNKSGLTYNVRPEILNDPKMCYLLILVVTAVCVALMYILTKTPFIMALKGSRENETRMIFLGVNIKNLRLVAYVISSFFGIIAGILYAIMNNGAYITSIDTNMALQAMMMCLIGGGATFIGPIIGAVLVTLITNYLPTVTNLDSIILGIIIILCCYFLPNGITDPNGKLVQGLKKLLKARPKEEGSR